MKKNCVEIKNIKGNISYINDGAFNAVNKIGVIIEVSVSFKKLVSSIKFIINTKNKKMNEIKKIFFVNFLSKYFL
jgi:hypothetical protein